MLTCILWYFGITAVTLGIILLWVSVTDIAELRTERRRQQHAGWPQKMPDGREARFRGLILEESWDLAKQKKKRREAVITLLMGIAVIACCLLLHTIRSYHAHHAPHTGARSTTGQSGLFYLPPSYV